MNIAARARAARDAWTGTTPDANARRSPVRTKLPFNDVKSNLTYGKEAIAWYRLPEVRWTGLTDAQRMAAINDHARGEASLVGKTLHFRGTVRPLGAQRWRTAWDNIVRTHSDPPDEAAWNTRLDAEEDHLRRTGTSTMEWFIGIPVAGRSIVDRANAEIKKGVGDKERTKLSEALDDVNDAAKGWGCTAASHTDLVWLIGQSVGLHVPQRDSFGIFGTRIAETDLSTLTDGVTLHPAGKYTRVVAAPSHTGLSHEVESWVAVLSVGRTEAQSVPGKHRPLVALSQALPFPTEWSLIHEVIPGQEAEGKVRKKIDGALDNAEQLAKHHLQVDPETESVASLGRQIRHEMTEGDTLASTRVNAWLRVAVPGKSRRECEKRCRELARLYGKQRISIEHPRGQVALLSEFIPGAKRATVAHERKGAVTTFAAMVPTMTALVGDSCGLPLGRTSGAVSRAVLWNPFAALFDGESSGYTPVIGGLGAGKTTLMSYLLAECVLGGAVGTAIDPTGVISRLADILPDAEVLDLLTDPEPGILSPWSENTVPIPRRLDYSSPEAWRQAKDDASRRRVNLARDDILGVLPGEFFDTGTHTRALVSAAVMTVGGDADRGHSMESVCAALDADTLHPTEAKGIASYLRSISTDPRVATFFAPCTARHDLTVAGLLIIRVVGLDLPEAGVDRREWTDDERIGVTLLRQASFMATARVFGIAKEIPKVLALDETHFLSKDSSGRQLQQRLIRTCRDRRTRVLAGTHLADDIFINAGGMLCEELFIGRTTDEQYQQGALRMLRQVGNSEIGNALGRLSGLRGDASDAQRAREFFFRDSRGRVEKVIIDLRHWPELVDVLSPAKKAVTETVEDDEVAA